MLIRNDDHWLLVDHCEECIDDHTYYWEKWMTPAVTARAARIRGMYLRHLSYLLRTQCHSKTPIGSFWKVPKVANPDYWPIYAHSVVRARASAGGSADKRRWYSRFLVQFKRNFKP